MEPNDVPRVEQDSMPDNRTTLQYMVESPTTEYFSVPPCDVQADWRDERHPPPSILLDFMYGAAVVHHWKCAHLREMLEERFRDFFQPVMAKIPEPSPPEDDEFEERDDPKDLDYDPSKDKQKVKGKGKGKVGKILSSDASAGLLQAMDDVLLLGMLLKGTTPQSIAAERERRREGEELRSQEQSREKVQQWLNLSGQSQVAL
ncbi:hypothetical protein L210DRAFT_3555865 [Boletus edulis BED1]|uniref:Uncharacterized protein n=1 Tax=Boletus edulis BED1 TaxID=1328754 RepID=A0AAD4GBF3_BOLED|nr:hypothetical protein L210DRAFT_3555865 [Boletus edulis BED1]